MKFKVLYEKIKTWYLSHIILILIILGISLLIVYIFQNTYISYQDLRIADQTLVRRAPITIFIVGVIFGLVELLFFLLLYRMKVKWTISLIDLLSIIYIINLSLNILLNVIQVFFKKVDVPVHFVTFGSLLGLYVSRLIIVKLEERKTIK